MPPAFAHVLKTWHALNSGAIANKKGQHQSSLGSGAVRGDQRRLDIARCASALVRLRGALARGSPPHRPKRSRRLTSAADIGACAAWARAMTLHTSQMASRASTRRSSVAENSESIAATCEAVLADTPRPVAVAERADTAPLPAFFVIDCVVKTVLPDALSASVTVNGNDALAETADAPKCTDAR